MRVKEILYSLDVSFVEEGKNVKVGNVNIKCPFCGPRDPSEHMGIDLETGMWSCWRNAIHSGKAFARLVQRLSHRSWEEALRIVEDPSAPVNLVGRVKTLLSQEESTGPVRPLEMPKQFQGIAARGPTKRFWQYLRNRGFDDGQICRIVSYYPVRCALVGQMRFRFVFLIQEAGELIGWVGRAITKESKRRYILIGERNSLLFLDQVTEEPGQILYIMEGPFDALKLDLVGMPLGARACSTFGTRISDRQVGLIRELSRQYRTVYLLFDSDAVQEALLARQRLMTVPNLIVKAPPRWYKDIGDMPSGSIRAIIEEDL